MPGGEVPDDGAEQPTDQDHQRQDSLDLAKRDETADGVGDGGAAEQWAEKLKDADDDYCLRRGHGARRDDVGGIVEAVDVIEEQGDYDGDDG